MSFRVSTKQGFTIIELLLTIGLITLLSGAVLTATGSSRNEAKNVKVKTDIQVAQRSLASHDAKQGGYPNPDPGEKKLYCIGSTECLLRGEAVTTYLNPLTGETSQVAGQGYKYDDLIPFINDDGSITQGYMYLSCGDPADICYEADETYLIFGQVGDTYSTTLETNNEKVAYNATTLGITESTFNTTGGGDEEGGIPPGFNTFCGWPGFNTDNFRYGTNNHCVYVEGDYGGEYYCNTSCSSVVAEVLPYQNCTLQQISSYNSCVEDYGEAGITYYRCQNPCDYNPD